MEEELEHWEDDGGCVNCSDVEDDMPPEEVD